MKISNVKNKVILIPDTENQKGIENHKRIARHYKDAAKSHLQAAKHHQGGNHQRAAESTIAAYGHVSLAKKAQNQDIRHHALNGMILANRPHKLV